MSFIVTILVSLLSLFSVHLGDAAMKLGSFLEPSNKVVQMTLPTKMIYPEPLRAGNLSAPAQAKHFYALDLATATPLTGATDAAGRTEIASLTKIMTFVVASEKENLNSAVAVPTISLQPDESRMGLKPGEKITVRDLLYGLLIPSGGDAALVLAGNYPGGSNAFITAMNAKASAIGLTGTHFANPVGIDDPDNYSTAADLALLTRYTLSSELFRTIIATKSIVVTSESGQAHNLLNTNTLLSASVRGVKTGNTAEAGQCLIALINIDGHEVLAVMTGSGNRFGEMAAYLTGVRRAYSWEQS